MGQHCASHHAWTQLLQAYRHPEGMAWLASTPALCLASYWQPATPLEHCETSVPRRGRQIQGRSCTCWHVPSPPLPANSVTIMLCWGLRAFWSVDERELHIVHDLQDGSIYMQWAGSQPTLPILRMGTPGRHCAMPTSMHCLVTSHSRLASGLTAPTWNIAEQSP